MKDIDTYEGTAEYIGCTPGALRNRRYRGLGPPAIKLAPGQSGAVRFRKVDVDRWLNEHAESPTSAA